MDYAPSVQILFYNKRNSYPLFLVCLLSADVVHPHVSSVCCTLYWKTRRIQTAKNDLAFACPRRSSSRACFDERHSSMCIPFPDDAAIWTEEAYKYGWGYFLTVFWGVSCGIAALSVMFFKSKLPKKRWVLWIPVISFLITGISVVLYALRIPFARAIGWDLAIFESMAFTVFFESCIQSGLIQSNTRYADMFRASRDLSVQITDNDYVVQYSAENAEPISREILEKAEASPIVLNDGKLIHNMPISGGRAVWTEDISELLS